MHRLTKSYDIIITIISRYQEFWVKEFNDKGNILMEKFRLLADGKTLVTLFQEVNRFALDVISSVRTSDFIIFKEIFESLNSEESLD